MFGLSRLALQLVASGGIAAVLVGSCVVRDRNRDAATVAKIEKASMQDGKNRAEKSDKAHADSRKPGAAARLRADPTVCPDCNR